MSDCVVCLNKFTVDGSFVPCVLECAHTVCGSCLEGNRLPHCPTCRSPIAPRSWKKNFEVIKILDSRKPLSVCSQCELDFQSERARICMTCSNNLDPNWIEKPFATAKSTSFYLCGECVYSFHNSDEHLLRTVPEIQHTLDVAECREHLARLVTNVYKQVAELEEEERAVVKAWEKGTKEKVSRLLTNSEPEESVELRNTIDTAHKDVKMLVEAHRQVTDSLKKLINSLMDPPPLSKEIDDEAASRLEAELDSAIEWKVVNNLTLDERLTKCFNAVGRKEFGTPTLRTVFKHFGKCVATYEQSNSMGGAVLRQILYQIDDDARQDIIQGLADFCEWALLARQCDEDNAFWKKFIILIAHPISCNNPNSPNAITFSSFKKIIDTAANVPNFKFEAELRRAVAILRNN